ncbi:unnamed protein product [Rotaria magnacalcarata]|uniref:Amino acid transporter n=1 Tax=Rotaria magnacalcarata TaxID=392030 RepID=A0A816MEK9_9BILA|nr:unnamed protein product [Rotaria magnacalcarata]
MTQKIEDADIRLLEEMGYKQELYRGFSPFMSFAFCFTAVNVLASISIGFTYSLTTGGSGVTIWAWVIGSLFTILIGLSLAEICSVYPSAGSVYHWAGQLVPVKHAPLASFICGWFNFLGNFAGDVAFASGFATIVNAAIIMGGNDSLNIGAQVGIGIGITFVWAVQNALRIDQQGWLNNFAVFFQLGSAITIVVVLFSMAPERATARDVFTSTYNGTGFSFPYVCVISILSTLFSFSGYEAGAHLAEETRGASRAAPKGIVGTCICSAITGFVYLLALLFSIPDINNFIMNNSGDNSTQSFTTDAYQAAVPYAGALALTILLIINLYFAGMSSLTVTTRIGFAMARDGVFPLSIYLRWIFEPTKTPLGNVIFVFFIDSLLLLLQLASETAFSAILSIATLGFQISYFMPILFRCTTARRSFPVGEFNLGRFGLPIAIISATWLFITSIIMFFPSEYPVTKDSMNYAVVIVGGVFLLAAMYWIFSARHWFIGPKRTTTNSNEISLNQTNISDINEIKTSPSLIHVRL